MPFSLRDFVRDVHIALQDADGTRWPADEVVRHTQESLRRVIKLRPEAYSERRELSLAPGSRQSVPEDAFALLDILRNLAGRGQAVRPADARTLDVLLPSWRSAREKTEIVHFTQDSRESRVFDVYPPAAPGASVEALLSVDHPPLPPPAGPSADDVPSTAMVALDAMYRLPLLLSVLALAWAKDAEYASNADLAGKFDSKFLTELMGEKQVTDSVKSA